MVKPKPSGLGRGLSSLIPPKAAASVLPKTSEVISSDSIVQAPVGKIKANPHQPRAHIEHESLEELVNSIREHGILQPLIVTAVDGGYQLIAGERRLRAAEVAQFKTVPVIVRQAKEQEQLELALIENIQRRDLNPVEEAVAYQRLIDEFNLTQEQAAKRVGKSRSVVANTIRLLTLPTEIQKAVMNNTISYSVARIIVGLPPEQRKSFFDRVLRQQGTTVRDVEGQARKVSVRRHFRKMKDPELAALEERLQRSLGTKVTIKKTGQGGQIIIDYFSAEELSNLAGQLGGQE